MRKIIEDSKVTYLNGFLINEKENKRILDNTHEDIIDIKTIVPYEFSITKFSYRFIQKKLKI